MDTIQESMEKVDINTTPEDSISLMYSGEPPEHIAVQTRHLRAALSRETRTRKHPWNYTSYWFWLKASNRASSYFSEGALIPGNFQSWEDDYADWELERTHEIELFDHSDYGDIWDAMAKHCQVRRPATSIAYREPSRHDIVHTKPYLIQDQPETMNYLDRIILEDCTPSADNTTVMAPHPNLSTSPYYLTPRWLISKIRYPRILPPLTLASNRASSFSSSTPSPSNLTLSFQNAQDFLTFFETIGNTRPLVDSFVTWINASGIASGLKYFGHLAAQLSDATTNPDDFLDSLQRDPPAPSLHAYHTIGEQDLPDYYDTIPDWFTSLLNSIENCSTLEAVSALGKLAFIRNLGEYTGVFWMHYNRHKKALTPRIVPKAEFIIATINSTRFRSRLAKIGKRLYELQADPNYIPTTNWNSIWATYKDRKAQITPQRPVQQSLF